MTTTLKQRVRDAAAPVASAASGEAVNTAADHSARRAVLGEFLKARRARVSPTSCGFAAGARRRTPGLRREEVAQLCAISATWYTWLEQGREIAVSGAVLERLARALRLNDAERTHLFQLAGRTEARTVAGTEAVTEAARKPPALQLAVDAIREPAYVLGRHYEPLAWNRAAAAHFSTWLGRRAAAATLLEYMFLEPSAREFVVDWPVRARRLVAEFRADASAHLEEPGMRGVIASLSNRSAEFRRYWSLHDVIEREGGLREFRPPRGGLKRLEQVNLWLAHQRDFKLVMLVPLSAG